MNSKIMLAAPFAVVAVILGTTTWIQGDIVNRWGQSSNDTLQKFNEALDKVPKKFGNWVAVEELERDPEQLKYAKVTGNFSWLYRNVKTKQEVRVFLVSGKPQNIADHEPDMCYPAAGYSIGGKGVRQYPITVGDDEDYIECTTKEAVFQKQEGTDPTYYLRILWTWKSGPGPWEAPAMPSFKFGFKPALYKLYLITNYHNESLEDCASVQFLEDFTRPFDKAVFPEQSSSSS